MLMRFVGTLIVIAAGALVYVAVHGLWQGDEMARTLAMFAESTADPFDANDWRWRWRLSSGLLLILGVVGVVAGIGNGEAATLGSRPVVLAGDGAPRRAGTNVSCRIC
jgi:hypothetical protein